MLFVFHYATLHFLQLDLYSYDPVTFIYCILLVLYNLVSKAPTMSLSYIICVHDDLDYELIHPLCDYNSDSIPVRLALYGLEYDIKRFEDYRDDWNISHTEKIFFLG